MTTARRVEGTNLATIFARLWDGSDALTSDLARHLLTLRFADDDVARMRELTARNTAGELTPAETAELDDFIRAGDLLAVLQSKARMRLGRKARGRHG
jgi:hypothetical protein